MWWWSMSLIRAAEASAAGHAGRTRWFFRPRLPLICIALQCRGTHVLLRVAGRSSRRSLSAWANRTCGVADGQGWQRFMPAAVRYPTAAIAHMHWWPIDPLVTHVCPGQRNRGLGGWKCRTRTYGVAAGGMHPLGAARVTCDVSERGVSCLATVFGFRGCVGRRAEPGIRCGRTHNRTHRLMSVGMHLAQVAIDHYHGQHDRFRGPNDAHGLDVILGPANQLADSPLSDFGDAQLSARPALRGLAMAGCAESGTVRRKGTGWAVHGSLTGGFLGTHI